MEYKRAVQDRDLVQFSLDVWCETGLITAEFHALGTFYYSNNFSAPEFNFFMPSWKITQVPNSLIRDIKSFYEDKGLSPTVYCPDHMVAQFKANKDDILFSEVMMRADAANSIRLLEQREHPADSSITFRETNIFTDKDYSSIYGDVFLSDNFDTQYKQIYLGFKDALRKAVDDHASFSPWVQLAYDKKDHPVSMTTIIPKGNFAGIYNVATLPSFRGKGFAARTMREAFKHAHDEGINTLFLITENHSDLEDTYSRMGFSAFARYSAFSL